MAPTKPVGSFHAIAALVYHMNYFVSATLNVLQEERWSKGEA